jgi:hypothetical protein
MKQRERKMNDLSEYQATKRKGGLEDSWRLKFLTDLELQCTVAVYAARCTGVRFGVALLRHAGDFYHIPRPFFSRPRPPSDPPRYILCGV